MTLSQPIIINKLSIDVKSKLDQKERVVYLPNPDRKPYLITDNHRDSPVGFGIKISPPKRPVSFNDGWKGVETGYQIYDWQCLRFCQQ